MAIDAVELKFKGQKREVFANPQHLHFEVGDYIIVQADNGIDMGQLNHLQDLKVDVGEGQKVKKVIRKSSPGDLEKLRKNEQSEEHALRVCKEKLKKHKLKMKLVDCVYQFDRKKITFHFTADGRVDFRKLVKDVAGVFKTRIEFRQIGVRDEARRLGGYGVCGQQLCCNKWLRNFMPVTTQAAKEQNLSLNPSKLAGVCGRLKCCLMYERDFYNQAIKQYPELAKPIATERGEGIVTNVDIFAESIVVLYDDDETETLSLDYLQEHVFKCDNGCGSEGGHAVTN